MLHLLKVYFWQQKVQSSFLRCLELDDLHLTILFVDHQDYNIDKNIPSDSSVFFNNSKVINAKLIFKNRNNTKIEILVINLFNKNYKNLLFNKKKVIVETMIKNIKKWKENETIEKAENDITLKVKQLKDNKVIFTWNKNKTWLLGNEQERSRTKCSYKGNRILFPECVFQ